MKIEYVNEYNFHIYLNKYYLIDLELDDKHCIEEYFKQIFMNLRNNYDLDIYGYYNIKVYTDKQYGIIIDVFKLSNDYFKVPGNKVDMKIMINSDSIFLYEITDYFLVELFKDYIKNIYYKDENYYLELCKNVDEVFYLYLMEHSRILFNDQVHEIMATSSLL
ncbi:MAG: hypothetical protein PHT75_04635 [Bacilli bacterium]|nr:hypothetical protein [Bacilli bacterium]MDD3305378.1 hypothetical protein [Bacilli bacterium]MDD4053431.1 hypothetical protein [Bacilli bacterium]MDD4410922.1 hypothetical protein [Bacilli bacterium]